MWTATEIRERRLRAEKGETAYTDAPIYAIDFSVILPNGDTRKLSVDMPQPGAISTNTMFALIKQLESRLPVPLKLITSMRDEYEEYLENKKVFGNRKI